MKQKKIERKSYNEEVHDYMIDQGFVHIVEIDRKLYYHMDNMVRCIFQDKHREFASELYKWTVDNIGSEMNEDSEWKLHYHNNEKPEYFRIYCKNQEIAIAFKLRWC